MPNRHITLIRPPSLVSEVDISPLLGSPPLGVAYLAGSLKQAGYCVTVIDAVGEGLERRERLEEGLPLLVRGLSTAQIIARIPRDTAAIGFSCMFSGEWLCHREIVRAVAAARPGVPIIVGGEHATAMPEHILRQCPGVAACGLGEGEETLLDFLRAIEDRRPLEDVPGLCIRDALGSGFVRTEPRKRMRALDDIPWPDWEQTPLEEYMAREVGYGISRSRNMPMLASRGCPYDCTFCSSPQMWGRYWNVRTPQRVIDEMKHYRERYGADSFSFYDLTTVVKRSWILEFTQLLIDQRMDVTWLMPSGTRSEALDREVVRMLKKSGCTAVAYAPESGSPATLARIRKKVHIGKMLESMRACTREGVVSKGHIILGLPGERPREFLHTVLFILRMALTGVNDVSVYSFMPYPGNVLCEELRGRLPEGDALDRFLALNCNVEPARAVSFNEYFSDRQIRFLAFALPMMFYAVQYAARPWRLAASATRLARRRPLTLLERVIYNVWHAKTRRSPPPSASGSQHRNSAPVTGSASNITK